MPKISKTKKVKVFSPNSFSIKLGEKGDLSYLKEKLKTNTNWYQAMVENMQNGVWVADKNVRVLYANPSLCKLLGYSFSEMVGKSEYNFWDKKSVLNVRKIVSTDRKNGISSSYEGKLVSKSGKTIPVLCLGTPLPDGGTVGIMTDLREIKKKDEKLKENEIKFKRLFNKYRELFNNMSNGVAVYEAINNGNDFILKDFNTAAEKIEKIKRKNIIGRRLKEAFPGVKKMGLFKVLQKVWKTGRPQNYSNAFYEDNRVSGWHENYVYKLPTGEIVTVYDDITERKKAEELMIKLKQATEQSVDGVALANIDGKIEFANSAWGKIHGYNLNEIKNKHLSMFHTKEQLKNDVIPFNQKVIKKGVNQGEIGHVKKDGTIFPTFMTTTLIKNAKNQPMTFIGTARDITKQKEADYLLQQRIRELNVLYRTHAHLRMANLLSKVLSDITRDIIHVFRFMDVVQAKIIFDKKIYKSSNKKFNFLYKIEEPIIVAGVKRGVMQVGYTQKMPQIEKQPFLNEERRIIKSVVQIITRHIYSRETIDRHRKIVRRSFTGIFITVNGVIEYLNPGFCRTFKVKEKEAIGKNISDFILYPKNRFKNPSASSSYHHESEGVQSDGNIINLDIVAQSIDYHGKKAALWRVYDITALKKAELKLKNFNIELKQLVKEKTHHLELANKRLQSLNELKDEFIAVTSHELRSPLTSIRGYLSFLIEKESLECVPDSIQQYLLRAYHNAESLNQLVNNILDVSRLDTGRFELQTVKTDLIHLAKNVIDSLSFQTNEKNLEIQLSNPSYLEKLILEVDQIRLSQVLRNLLDNAIKYTPRNKKIIVEVKTDLGFAIIKVIDNGVGIPKEQIENIFEKFIQIKNADGRYMGGAGLGLFIAKRIVQLHGGIIKAESQKSKGTTFTIQLPLMSI